MKLLSLTEKIKLTKQQELEFIDVLEDDIKKYFTPEYDEQKIRTFLCQILEEWSNQNH